MIAIICGTPGAGKSLYCVGVLVRELVKMKRKIFCDIDGVWDKRYTTFSQLGLDPHMADYYLLPPWHDPELPTHDKPSRLNPVMPWEVPDGCLLITDEVQDKFNSRGWKDEANNLAAKFAATHRHRGIDWYIITQNPTSIDRQLREKAEICIYLVRTRALGVDRGVVRKTFMGGDNSGLLLNTTPATLTREHYQYYNSYQVGQDENNTIKVKNPFTKYLIVGTLAIIATAFFLHRAYTKVMPKQAAKAVPHVQVLDTTTSSVPYRDTTLRGRILVGNNTTDFRNW